MKKKFTKKDETSPSNLIEAIDLILDFNETIQLGLV